MRDWILLYPRGPVDSYGQATLGAPTGCWAEVRDAVSKDRTIAQGMSTDATRTAAIRYRAGLDTTYTAQIDGYMYQVVSVASDPKRTVQTLGLKRIE